ncbi:MAG: acylphosphatase [Patescibacteria group bacterium]|jgi:acylphosphatase
MQLKMLVSGKVQGVWYRASTAKIACDLGLKGYAKNLSDGSVEIVAIGAKAPLEKLRKWCELGPSKAQVDWVAEEWSESAENFADFAVI